MPYAALKLQLHAVIDDTEIDVVTYSDSFMMNGLPAATLLLPVGRDTRTLRAAASHELAANLQQQLKAEVYLTVQELSADTEPMMAVGTFKIFEGYVVGAGYRRQHGQAQMVVHLLHWLVDLTHSSTLSASSHPANPGHFAFNAATIGGAGTDGDLHFISSTRTDVLVTPDTVAKDFWGLVLLPWLKELASEDRLNIGLLSEFEVKPSDNTDALKALARFEGPQYTNGVPLALDLKSLDGPAAAAAIANALSLATYESVANMTFWDFLVGHIVPHYMLSVVPLVNKALLVPFIPGLQSYLPGPTQLYSISADEIATCSISGSIPRPLRAVGIFSGMPWVAGGEMGPDTPIQTTIGGWYQGQEHGLVLFKTAPNWLSHGMSPFLYGKMSAPANQPVADAASPAAGKANDGKAPREIRQLASTMLNRFAQGLYAYEVLKGRMGEISGPLRYDICPGSTVRIEGAPERFIAQDEESGDSLGAEFYGSVIQVQSLISATGQASTAFKLAHIRNSRENKSTNFSSARHPIWTNPWVGASLLADAVPQPKNKKRNPVGPSQGGGNSPGFDVGDGGNIDDVINIA